MAAGKLPKKKRAVTLLETTKYTRKHFLSREFVLFRIIDFPNIPGI
jgi:hypothetical protein